MLNPSTSNFEFINTEGSNAQVAPSARRAARVHVMRKYHSDKRNKSNTPPQTQQAPNPTHPFALPLRNSPRLAASYQFATSSDVAQERPSNAPNPTHHGTLIPYIWNGWCQKCHKRRSPNHEALVPEASLLGQCTCTHPTIPTGIEPTPQSSFPVDPSLVTLLQFCEWLIFSIFLTLPLRYSPCS